MLRGDLHEMGQLQCLQTELCKGTVGKVGSRLEVVRRPKRLELVSKQKAGGGKNWLTEEARNQSTSL